jgi:transcriptional regulator with XRE-family HTH domain
LTIVDDQRFSSIYIIRRKKEIGAHFMKNIREQRLKKGWSLTRLSGLTGIASGDLSQIERGLRVLHPGWRQRIARALGVPANELSADHGGGDGNEVVKERADDR